MTQKENKQDLVTYADLGYMRPPPKKFWPDKGKGIRCANCVWFGKTGDIEDTLLGACGLLPQGDNTVHEQACCNFQWNPEDKENPKFMDFPGSDVVKRKLPFYGKTKN